MTGPTRSPRDIDLVKVAYNHDEMEAELLQGLLGEADVGSVVRRAPGFDVPEFLAAGPRHVLVAASDVSSNSSRKAKDRMLHTRTNTELRGRRTP
jgi:hypothetical protein